MKGEVWIDDWILNIFTLRTWTRTRRELFELGWSSMARLGLIVNNFLVTLVGCQLFLIERGGVYFLG